VQIPDEIADWIAESLRESQADAERSRRLSVHELQQRQRALQKKLDRGGYEDYLESRISNAFWRRKSTDWEAEPATIEES
jgi:hypothetical protein